LTEKKPYTNSLIHESSLYLLQHAHNPVNWMAWNNETLELAKRSEKPILLSIGYSACHWCHVMEHESFEDEPTARLMNEYFICIKVDREERPDIDQVYMDAVQLMTGRGGWPLNCFLLPDGRPYYGGTYFPRKQWQDVLNHLAALWKDNREKVFDYAAQLTDGMQKTEWIPGFNTPPAFSPTILDQTVQNWEKRLDTTEGGPDHAPKFPLPNNYQFLLRYAHLRQDKVLLDHVELTLQKMAFGGIYDQLGGGFSRYSTDKMWKIPHFEKMLYDNAQLISLYSEAFQKTANPLYKTVVYETIEFVNCELCSPEGAFYSALDADTEGEEGKYYVWTKEELKTVLGDSYQRAADFYNTDTLGRWDEETAGAHESETAIENTKHVLIRTQTDTSPEIQEIRNKLFQARLKRAKPGLDDKCLTS
jgi:uncharacterized protein YyaL (SSP411 family)